MADTAAEAEAGRGCNDAYLISDRRGVCNKGLLCIPAPSVLIAAPVFIIQIPDECFNCFFLASLVLHVHTSLHMSNQVSTSRQRGCHRIQPLHVTYEAVHGSSSAIVFGKVAGVGYADLQEQALCSGRRLRDSVQLMLD